VSGNDDGDGAYMTIQEENRTERKASDKSKNKDNSVILRGFGVKGRGREREREDDGDFLLREAFNGRGFKFFRINSNKKFQNVSYEDKRG